MTWDERFGIGAWDLFWDLRLGVSDLGFGMIDFGIWVLVLRFGTWDLGLGVLF